MVAHRVALSGADLLLRASQRDERAIPIFSHAIGNVRWLRWDVAARSDLMAAYGDPGASRSPLQVVGPALPAAPPGPLLGLPSSSTLDRAGTLALVGLLLAVIGALLLRSRRSAPTVR